MLFNSKQFFSKLLYIVRYRFNINIKSIEFIMIVFIARLQVGEGAVITILKKMHLTPE